MRKQLQMHHFSTTSAPPSEPKVMEESMQKPIRKQLQDHNFSHLLEFLFARISRYFGLRGLKMEPWMQRYSHGFGAIPKYLWVGEGVNAAPRDVLC